MQGRTRPWPACPPSPPVVPSISTTTAQAQRAQAHAHPSPPSSSVATPSPPTRRGSEGGLDSAAMALAAALSSSRDAFPHKAPVAAAATPVSTPASASSSQSPPSSLPHHSIPSAPVNIPTQALSPPTPAPSPTPTERWSLVAEESEEESLVSNLPIRNASTDLISRFRSLPKDERFAFLSSLVGELQLNEALVVSSKISPKLKRDFLSDLPIELALHCVSFIDDARTLGRSMRVCKYWNELLQDERLWKDMYDHQLFRPTMPLNHAPHPPPTNVAATGANAASWPRAIRRPLQPSTFREKFRDAYLTETNWLSGGRLLTMHSSMGDSVVTSLVVNDDYIVIGMANSKIHVFEASTGHYRLSLLGHELGVWALVLVSPHKARDRQPSKKKGRWEDKMGSFRRASFSHSETGSPTPTTRSKSTAGSERTNPPRATQRMRSSDVCGSAQGWGLKRTLVVSGGCDREVRVWDIVTGECVHSLRGHSSTIRCLKVLDGRPIAVSGSRDFSLRVWDIDRGRMLRVLEGHEQSVRCIEIAGNQVVSGSYDYTCRLWDIDTGDCLQVFEGHYHQIYAVAFDGERVVSGSLDSTVRVWDAGSGECLAILQGHTSLVGQLQLSGDRLITGGSDGRVIVFNLNDYSCVHRLCAHDNSVTCLQFDHRFIVSGGNDGRVKLWDLQTGTKIRELTRPCDAVWRVCFRDDKCAILCQRDGKTVLEVLGFRPQDEQLRPSISRTPDW